MGKQTIKDLLIYMDLQILSQQESLNFQGFKAMLNIDCKYNGQFGNDKKRHKLICDAIEYLDGEEK